MKSSTPLSLIAHLQNSQVLHQISATVLGASTYSVRNPDSELYCIALAYDKYWKKGRPRPFFEFDIICNVCSATAGSKIRFYSTEP